MAAASLTAQRSRRTESIAARETRASCPPRSGRSGLEAGEPAIDLGGFLGRQDDPLRRSSRACRRCSGNALFLERSWARCSGRRWRGWRRGGLRRRSSAGPSGRWCPLWFRLSSVTIFLPRGLLVAFFRPIADFANPPDEAAPLSPLTVPSGAVRSRSGGSKGGGDGETTNLAALYAWRSCPGSGTRITGPVEPRRAPAARLRDGPGPLGDRRCPEEGPPLAPDVAGVDLLLRPGRRPGLSRSGAGAGEAWRWPPGPGSRWWRSASS